MKIKTKFWSCLLLAALLAIPTLAGPADARMTGEVVDEDGKPLADVVVMMVPEDSSEQTVSTTTNKKGRFALPALRPIAYHPEVEAEGYVLMKVRAMTRGGDGSRLGTFEQDDIPSAGYPVLQIQPASRITMTVELLKRETRTVAQGAGLAGVAAASGELEVLNALFEVGKWQELLNRSEAFLAQHPDVGGAHYLRAIAHWRLGDYDGAQRHFTRAVELTPDQPGIRGAMGGALLEHARALSKAGDTEGAKARAAEAAVQLKAQVEATPDDPTYMTNYVIACETAGQLDAAIDALRAMVQANPTRRDAVVRLGELLVDAQKPEQAIEVLSTAPQPDGRVASLIYNAAVLLWNDGNAPATVEAMNLALTMNPEDPLLHRLKGRALLSAGDTEQAIRSLEEAVRLAPDDPASQTDLSLIQALKKS